MWRQARLRVPFSVASRVRQTAPKQRLIKSASISGTPANSTFSSASQYGRRGSGGSGGSGGAAGGGWHQGGSSRRSARNFQQVVPLPWLAVACFSAVDITSNAYIVETEDFRRIVQRCNFHIAAAAAGDVADLSSLYDLLDWVYDSIDAVGPTALPKLLDAGVIDIALRGAQSPNINMSTLCHEMLNVLSSNEHVATMMARDPSLRATVVGEITRQLSGWKSAGPGDGAVQLSPDQVHDATSRGDAEEMSSVPPARRGSHRRRASRGIMGAERRHRPAGGVDAGAKDEGAPYAVDAVGDEGGGAGEDRVGAVSSAASLGENDEEEEAVPVGTIVLDPFYVTLCLRTLSNVMRASRGSGLSPDPAADGGDASLNHGWGRGLKLPWPVRLLYGGSVYGEGGGVGGREGTMEWTLEQKDVVNIAELMVSVSARGAEGARVVQGNEDADMEAAAQLEAQHALYGLESAAAAVLKETSSHPQLVKLLMRRRPLVALVTLGWKGHSVKSEDWAAEAALNVCAAYRRLHDIPAAFGPKMESQDVLNILTTWTETLNAEGEAGIPDADLGASEDDVGFVLQAEQAIPPLALSDPLLTATASTVVGLAGVAWGAVRRWVAWRRAGETFAAVSRLALPRAVLWAGLRAGLGATLLTATHGPFGFRSQMRYRTLDGTSGSRGTLAMSGIREAVDLSYLYVILRLCPYSLLPAFVLNAMLRGGPVGADTWGP